VLNSEQPPAATELHGDVTLFTAVVQALAVERALPLRIDPRPLDPRAPGTRRAEISAENLQRRGAALTALEIPLVDVLAGEPCSGRGGMPPPLRAPGEGGGQPQGPFSCAVLYLPRSATKSVDGPSWQTRPSRGGAWITRAIVVEPGVWAEYEITASRGPDGGWTVVEVTRLIEVVS
jgi:hypothetical protein